MRKRLVLAVLAMSLLSILVPGIPGTGLSSQVSAQTELEDARDEVAATTDKLEALLRDLEATQRRGDDLAREYWQVESMVAKLDTDISASEAATEQLELERRGLRDEVRVIAVDQYVSREQDVGIADHQSEADRAAAETLARLVVGEDNDAIDQLARVDERHQQARQVLRDQRDEQARSLATVQATQESLFGELDRLAKLRVDLDEELAALEDALDALEEAEAERQAAAAEQARIEEARRRAEAAAAAAAERARQVPTPAPTPTVAPTPTPAPATPVPNPQPSEPFPTATAIPNPQIPDAAATAVPNPQLPDPTATAVPNPQPSEPFPTATAVPNPQLPDPTATAVPNPQPSTPVAPTGGGIVCPLAGPFTHTDDFDAPRAVGGIHRANDLISAQGTPVIAVASGTIDHRNSRVGGLSAHLKGDNGDYYFYTHLSGYENVGAGYVTAGTVIGYVGMTGNAPIPHLHFEIHRGGYGNYANPYGPVRAACF